MEDILEHVLLTYKGYICIVVVAVKNMRGWSAFIGAEDGNTYSEASIVEMVARGGNKLPENLARAVFPQIKEPYWP